MADEDIIEVEVVGTIRIPRPEDDLRQAVQIEVGHTGFIVKSALVPSHGE